MAATSPGSGTLELRGVCKRYGTGQGGQVTAAHMYERLSSGSACEVIGRLPWFWWRRRSGRSRLGPLGTAPWQVSLAG
jgi:hypothetical protein